ncbi:MAG: 1-(5-phosphoribosyl)-5-[(5-phosphoribosylamino)methylideneamino]imidazole-4-carboxamide isomerase [Desulfovibrio sp.]|nr:1-(5-phosphoribosyl)-5-[(5-phosphoribosylamino)methylideneamino]imidazole-4-carboxamide isomerase [Desulfovibrio sp.]
MIVFPAVDIKNGQCVRLQQGRPERETVFFRDPLEAALHWQNLGGRWLHLVDLDGAFAGKPVNLPLIARLCAALSIPVQVGGGIRSLETAGAYLEAGARRLIVGTMALEDPGAFSSLCAALPGKIGVSLDTEAGRLKTRGWAADAGLTLDEALPRLADQGAAFLVHTDIDRDGMRTGADLSALSALVAQSPLPVIASGGVADMEDIRRLYPLSRSGNLQGVISGRALYEGTLDLAEAMAWIDLQGSGPQFF